MTRDEAINILFTNGFIGRYYGPGHKSINNIDSFMSRYPRRNGISSKDKDKIKLYDACLIHKQELSRINSYGRS